MSDSANPLNDQLQTRISQLENRLYALETTNQPYQGDWIDLAPDNFAYVGTKNRVSTDFPVTNFGLGDKIRIRRDETGSPIDVVDYFYVVDTTNGDLDLFPSSGGNNISSSTYFSGGLFSVIDVAYSKLPAPEGFVFTTDQAINENVYLDGGSVTATPNNIDLTVSINTPIIIVRLDNFSVTAGASWSGFAIDLPIPVSSSIASGAIRNIFGRIKVDVLRGGTYYDAYSYVDTYTVGSETKVRIIVEAKTGTIPSGLFQIRGYAAYTFDLNYFTV